MQQQILQAQWNKINLDKRPQQLKASVHSIKNKTPVKPPAISKTGGRNTAVVSAQRTASVVNQKVAKSNIKVQDTPMAHLLSSDKIRLA